MTVTQLSELPEEKVREIIENGQKVDSKEKTEPTDDKENLKFLVSCLLFLHIERSFGEKSVAFAIHQLTDKLSEDEILEIFQESKEVFEKFAK